MRSILLSILLISIGAASDHPTSFDSSYVQLQKKIAALKEKGDKINEDSRREIDQLMAQMNHEHAELKRQLEKKNLEIQQKVNEGVKTEQDWSKRLHSAWQELGQGFHRAWEKVSKGEE